MQQLLHQLGVGQHVADPHIGRNALGVAAYVHHLLQVVEAGQARLRFGDHVGVQVVLHQAEAVLAGQLQQAVQLR
ncbi:hypothetical protein D3C84_924300 [compost metagenome]